MGKKWLPVLISFALCLSLVNIIIGLFLNPFSWAEQTWLLTSLTGFLILSSVSLLLALRHHELGLLVSGLMVVTTLRIAGIHDIVPVVCLAGVQLLLLFIALLVYLSQHKEVYSIWAGVMTFIRLYLGFNLMAHGSEKLLAGPEPFMQDVSAFVTLGVPMPEFFVALAGVCEIAGAIAIGLGLLTRLGAICTALYLFIATYLGAHFTLGYIWANPGGGWEYPTLWIVFTLVFAVTGAGKLSIDYLAHQRWHLPQWYHKLAGLR